VQRLDLLEQLSLYYANNRLPDSALKYDSIALQISKEGKDLFAQSNVLNNMGLSFYSKAEYATAIRLFQESLGLKEKISDTVAIVKSLNNLGVLYQLVGDYDQSISMLMRSLEIRKKTGRHTRYCTYIEQYQCDIQKYWQNRYVPDHVGRSAGNL